MSNFPRRSPRLSQQLSQQQFSSTTHASGTLASFPPFSPNSSASTPSQPSPTNDSLVPPSHHQQARLQVQSQFLPASSQFNAPLPSPSANEIESFLGRSQSPQPPFIGQQGPQNNMSQTPQYGFGGEQQSHNQSTQHHNSFSQHHNSFSQPHRPNIHPSNSVQMPQGLPPDFLAEAARRAQMACLMRDLGDVSL